jgi:hypothetical protein
MSKEEKDVVKDAEVCEEEPNLGECEVRIHFQVPIDKMQHIFDATHSLFKAGIAFDTGGSKDGKYFEFDWELDWSLRCDEESKCSVLFKKHK